MKLGRLCIENHPLMQLEDTIPDEIAVGWRTSEQDASPPKAE